MDVVQQQQNGVKYLERGQYREAISFYEQCIDADPANLYNYWNLGLALLFQGEELMAQSVWLSGIAQGNLEETDAIIANWMQILTAEAVRQYEAGNLHLAQSVYWQILEQNPNDAQTCYGLGFIFWEEKKIDEAIDLFQRTTELDNNCVEAYQNLGSCWLEKGNIDRAIESLGKAIELNPNYPEVYYNLGYCFKTQEKIDEAIAQLNKAIELHPEFSEAYLSLGICLREKRLHDEAIACLHKAIELKPDFPEAYYHIGLCFRDRGNIDEAISYFEKAALLKPEWIEPSHAIQQLIQCSEAGYAPIIRKGYGIWDAILFKDDDLYRLFYLMGDNKITPFWSVGDVGAAISPDLKKWQSLGTVMIPNPTSQWESGRMLAGSLYKENGIYYFFYSAAPSKLLLEEGIGIATSNDGIHWDRSGRKLVEPDPRFYGYSLRAYKGEEVKHSAWRDPYILKEARTGKYYMFITASFTGGNPHFRGCIGVAVGDLIEGPYQVLPPAAVPLVEGTEEGIFYEMERPQVIYKHNKYYLFFSMGPRFINPQWLDKVGRDRITSSSLYCYVSETITGPFKPEVEKPVVQGSENTGLYGTSLIEGPDGQFYACGCYYNTATLEVGTRFPVRWEENYIEIVVT